MRRYFCYLTALISTLIIGSCQNELPFSIKDNPPKLVMNALINADSPTNILYLNFTGKENTTLAWNATVEVRINGQVTESLRPLPLEQEEINPQSRFEISSNFTPGDVVRIDAYTDDGQFHAWAEVTVPQRPLEIEHIDTLTVPLKQSYSTQDCLRYKITINDRPGETNYYRIIVDKQTTLWDYNHNGGESDRHYWTLHSYSFVGREDIVLTDGKPITGDDEDNGMFDTTRNVYGVFDDSRFKDTSYIMTVYNSNHIDIRRDDGYFHRMDVFIRLQSITETEYYYLKALNYIDSDAYDETINEPIKFPGNVNGGTGIVSISTEVSQKIEIRKPQH